MGFFDIIGYVVQLIQEVINFVVSVVNWLVQAILQIAQFIWDALQAVATAIENIFVKIGRFFEGLWTNYIKPAINGLIKLYGRIRARLAAIFAPLVRLITRVRAWFYQYIYPWIKLAQQILSTIRVILSLFRILGAKWAAQLDADIARIQGYLTTALQDIVKTLNTASSLLNVLVDPGAIIRKDFFSGTLFSSLGAVKRAVAFGSNRALTPDEQSSEDGNKALINGGAAVLTRNSDGTVSYSPASQAMNRSFADARNYYGFPATLP